MKKRFLSILMALALALSLLPSAALASEATDGTGGGPDTTVADEQTGTTTEGGGETTTPGETEDSIPVETGDETDTSDGTETPVVTTPTVTPTETTPVETLTPVVQTIKESDVAAIGDQGYSTLDAAIEKVASGETIVLQKSIDNCAKVTIKKTDVTFTINFAGHTLTSDSEDWAFQIEAGNVTLKGGTVTAEKCGINVAEGAELTLADMEISTTDTTGGRVLSNYGTTTVKSGTYTGVKGAAQSLIYNEGEMTIKGGTFTQGCETRNAVLLHCNTAGAHVAITGGTFINDYGYGIYCSTGASMEFGGDAVVTSYAPALGGNNTTATADFRVTGGSLTSTGSAAIFFPSEGNLTITGGKITGLTGIHALMGDINISGGTITGTATVSDIEEEYPGSGSGPRSNGSALLLVSNWYTTCLKDNGLRVNITSGTLTSAEGAEAIDHMKPQTPEDTEFKVSISGGTFSTKPSADYIHSGYEAKEDTPSEGLWTVAAKDGMEANVTAPVGGATNSSAAVTGSFSTTQEPTGGEAGEGSVEAGGGSVTINVQTSKNEESGKPAPNGQVSSTTVTVHKASVSSVANAEVDVTLQTDVADLEIPSEAWKSMANAAKNDNITIAVKENKTGEAVTSWTVTAKAGGTDVFTEDAAAAITVMVTYDSEAENVVVYCTDSGKQEQMKTTWNKETKTLSWETPHFSTFAPVTYSTGTEASWIGANGQPTTGTLADALTAVASSGGTITLLNDATVNNANYTISKDVTIQTSAPSVGNVPTITVNVAAGASTVGITIQNGGSLTLDGAAMVVNGTAGTSGLESDKYNGTGLDVNYGGELTLENGASLALNGLNRGMVSSRPDSTNMTLAKITVDGSTLSADGIDGNFSNGGEFTFTNSIVNIKNCGNHGLSVEELTVTNSEVTLSGIGYSAIYGNELNFENGAVVNVSAAGSKLPQENWNGSETYTAPIQVKETAAAAGNLGHSMTVAQGASVSVTNSTTADGKANTIDLPGNATLTNDGTVNATINVAAPEAASNECIVQYVVNGQTVYVHAQNVQNGVTDGWNRTNPTLPSMIFIGWICTSHSNVSETTESDGTGTKKWNGVEAGQTYTFTAQFSPIVTPVVPDDNTPSYGGGSYDSEPSYSPVQNVSDGGTIKVSPRTAEEGDEVTITPNPDAGYEVADVTVTRNGRAIEVTENRDGTWTFTQPSGRVTIDVTFQRIGGEPVGFTDVPASFWAADEITWAYENGYVNGTTATTFNPNGTISRQQVWMILARLSGSDPADMAAARTWAMENGVSDGTNPGGAVTRQQLVALLYRFAEDRGYANDSRADLSAYPDAGTVAEYAVEPMRWSVANDIVGGTTAGTLNPEGTATRAQFAVILYRFWSNVV